MKEDLLQALLDLDDVVVRRNIDMAANSYLKVGGVCDMVIYPTSVVGLKGALKLLGINDLDFEIIGFTTNVIFSESIKSILINMTFMNNLEVRGDQVFAQAGVSLFDLLRKIYSLKCVGYEGLEGIPGSVGAAVIMNAGAYGYSISDHIVCVNCLDREGNCHSFGKQDFAAVHRGSFFEEQGLIVSEVVFDVSKKAVDFRNDVYKKVEFFHTVRHRYQEWVLPNTGSIFAASECPYKIMCDMDFRFKVLYKINTLLFRNFFVRKVWTSPNRRFLNYFAAIIFDFKKFNDVYSIKHVNTFSVTDETSSQDIEDFIFHMRNVYSNRLKLENKVIK